jgi:hypothetical protein
MLREPKSQEELYLVWLEERWDVHKLNLLHYSNGEREDRRTGNVIEIFKSLGELSRLGMDPPQSRRARPCDGACDGAIRVWATLTL